MSQLLVVIISIVMMAALLIAGAWFGGGTWLEGGSRAQAEQLINGAAQIAQAWHAYAQDNDGDYTLADLNWRDGTITDFSPKFLTTIPFFGFVNLYPVAPYQNYFYPVKLANNGEINDQPDSNALKIPGVPKKVCEQINLLAKGTASVSVTQTPWLNGGGTTAAAMADLQPFYCATFMFNGTTPYYFLYYRVF